VPIRTTPLLLPNGNGRQRHFCFIMRVEKHDTQSRGIHLDDGVFAMSSESVSPSRLVDTVRSLFARFSGKLAGSRQATRSELVRYLARELELTEEHAAHLFDHLRAEGVVVRGDEASLHPHSLAPRSQQQWAMKSESEVAQAAHRWPAQVELPLPKNSEDSTPAIDLLTRAIQSRASDIHIDPFDDEIEIRFRIDGRLEHYCRVSQEIGSQLTAQLKVIGNLDVTDPFHPQGGRLKLPPHLAEYNARISTMPVEGGDAVAIRLLTLNNIVRPLESIGLIDIDSDKVASLLKSTEGVVLVTGPTGSGKTTTVYSLVHSFDNGYRNIVSIEDPVEYRIPGFLQMAVDHKHHLTMGAGLSTLLRMDPDIILVGEILDEPTAMAAMRAASCGKYIFSTFHTRDAASLVTAFRDLNVDARSLAGNLRAILSQRLVRRLCEKCRQPRALTTSETELFALEGIDAPEQVYEPVGCEACHGTGYYERIGVFEIAFNSPDMAEAIQHGVSEREMQRLIRASGSTSLVCDGLKKVKRGITSLAEIQAMSWVELHATRN
jgi:type II secretory ATPase GspE/PulE/Tfp pilus assembly ATPase PilB-like protein